MSEDEGAGVSCQPLELERFSPLELELVTERGLELPVTPLPPLELEAAPIHRG